MIHTLFLNMVLEGKVEVCFLSNFILYSVVNCHEEFWIDASR